MKTFYRKNERGVALLFALGMLALLLVLGLAFVANALLAQKTARNNSSRTQARMLANSALNRAMAAIMVYDVSFRAKSSTTPTGFGGIFSKDKAKSDNDGLTGDESLLLLPEDDSLVSKNTAVKFNQGVKAFKGNWLYFYNGVKDDDEKQRIIGRAAWQVVSTAPPILYPVFMRGHLGNIDVDADWKPNVHRWGRDIDEVNFYNNTPLLQTVPTVFNGAGQLATSYDLLYAALNTWGDADKRWFETWFMPEPDPAKNDDGAATSTPSMLFSDTYAFIRNKQRRNYMRFNISEFSLAYSNGTFKVDWQSHYAREDKDQWYARFGSGKDITNNETALKNLTRDSADALPSDKFDYDVDAKERSGLPFLRRIGNDKGTFADLAALRKQIAANFNDYCDADNIPTSNIAAENWWTMTDWSTNAPLYTGNEKTPYLYELGFKIGMVQDAVDSNAAKGLKIGTISTTPGSTNYKVNVPISGALRVAPMVKLANIYKFNPADGVKNLKVGVDLESLKLKVRLKFKASVTINYVDANGVSQPPRTINNLILFNDSDTEYEKVLEAVMPAVAGEPAHILRFAADADVDNSGNANPYPLLVPKDANSDDKVWKNLEIKGVSAALTITPELLRNLDLPAGQAPLPSTFTINSVSVQSVQELKLLNVSLKTGRVVLAGDTNGKTSVGLDWVKPLEVAKEITATDMVLDFADADKAYPALLLGGIRNYDPRQNLNAGDWSLTDSINVKVSANFKENVFDEIKTVLALDTSSTTVLRGASNGDGDFAPNGKADAGDYETAIEPGAQGVGEDKHISTAFIRNAPMMSPWEIGFIHRGVKWQTINIKKAGAPGGSGVVTPENFSRIGDDKWDAEGTTYAGGDGAILEQIKMSDRALGYGKINVNMLRDGYANFDPERDKNIVYALFNGLMKQQSVEHFFTQSTRDADSGKFKTPSGEAGESLTFNEFNAFVQDDSDRPEGYYNRVHFLHAKSSMFIELAGGYSVPDARQEEIIGKVINLISADEVSPSQIQMVVVAQSIEDKAGQQVNRTDPAATVDCNFETFDPDGDEITGEVKMFVTIDRDPSGKLTVRRIDYIE